MYYTDYLEHYGILGMKWGVRRTPEQLGHRNLRNAKISNFAKWGTDRKHNVLYITGYSGSGKSTIAKTFLSKDTDVIHLDLYYEGAPNIIEIDGECRSAEFDSYLKSNGYLVPNEVSQNKQSVKNDFWKAIEDFGAEAFKKKRKVVVEGVQMLDDTFNPPPKSFFSDAPIVITGTNRLDSMRRAFKRDNRGGVVQGVLSLDNPADYMRWVSVMNRKIDSLTTSTSAKRNRRAVDEYLSQYGDKHIQG